MRPKILNTKPKFQKFNCKNKKLFLQRDINKFINDDNPILKRPYILYLSTKNRHWFNTYANPKFKNPKIFS